jgi:predicted flap endonuclease-1-like 5' DNA nuclease
MDCCSPLLDYIVPLGAAALGSLLFYLLGKKSTEDLEAELYEAEEKQHTLKADMERTSMHYRTLDNKVSVADIKYNTLETSFTDYKEGAEKELAAQKAMMNNTILLLRNDLERVKAEHATKLADAEQRITGIKNDSQAKIADAEQRLIILKNDSISKLAEAEKRIVLIQNESAAKVADAESRITLMRSEYQTNAQSITGAQEGITATLNETKRALGEAQSRYTLMLNDRDVLVREKSALNSQIANLKIDLETERRRYTAVVAERDKVLSERTTISTTTNSFQADLVNERSRYATLLLNFGNAEKRNTELENAVANLKIDVEGERRRYTTLLSERDRLITEKEQLSITMGSNQTGLNAERQRLAQVEANYNAAQTRIHELEIEIANIQIDLKAERNRYRVLMGERDLLLNENSNGYVTNGKTTTSITPLMTLPTKPDDLEIIEGIGAKIEQILYEAGIKTYLQLAQTPVEILRGILNKAGNRFRMHNPSTWPQQAALAAEGKWAELNKLKEELMGGKVSA